MLNDLTRPANNFSSDFRKRRNLDSRCQSMWKMFLWHLRDGEPRVDVAIWEIGGTVRLRPASTAIDESNPEFERPHEHFFHVKDYASERRKLEKQEAVDELEKLDEELWERLLRSIVNGLKNKTIQNRFREYNPDDKPFTVIATSKDEGLHTSEFTLVWKNDEGPSLATIRRRAKAAQGRPLPADERRPSPREQHLAKLKKSREKEKVAAKKYWDREQEKAEKRQPAARNKLEKRIEQGMAALPKPAPKSEWKKPGFPLSLDDGNQSERLLLPKVSLDKLAEIHATYQWSNFDEYDNRVWEYSYALLNPALKQAKAKRLTTVWNKLNRPQKVFYTFLEFVGQVDNGGVWQFLFNDPELSLAALEMLTRLGATRLARDYRKTLEELLGKAETVSKLRERFEDKQLSTAKRWSAFAKGYHELRSAKPIEKYFYTNKFKSSLFKKMSDDIENSLHLLARIPEIGATS